jgi:hypothetical protein
VAVSKTTLAAVSDAATKDLANDVRKKVATYSGVASVEKALALRGEPRGARISRLYELVSGGVAERMARVLDIMDTLRRELPDILSRLPLKLSHLNFPNIEALVQYVGEALFYMQTRAGSRAEFARGIEGWRWNLVGRVLFERLVKYHPQLDAFFHRLAKDLVDLVNQELAASRRALVDIQGNRPRVTPTFSRPEKVTEFRLVGADGVERDFTDFGFLATNRDGWWAMLPIELKMPDALRKVAEQFSEFVSRLKTGEKVIAIVERRGTLVAERIDPEKLLFMQHDRAQVAVAPLGAKAAQKLIGSRIQSVPPGDVATVVEFEPRNSVSRELQYYRIRLLVRRDWLEAVIRPITAPPKR